MKALLLSPKRLRRTLLDLHRSINPKTFTSRPQSPPTPSIQQHISELNLTSGHNNQNDVDVIRVLLGRRNDPVSALQYCSWVRPRNQILLRHGGDLFWVLIHILVTSPQTHDRARNLLVLLVSANPDLAPSVAVTHLIESAQRFDLGLDSRAFNYLLNAYLRNKRADDALECFNLMVGRKVVPFVCYVNSVLSSLVRRNEIGEAKEVYNKMVEIGVGGDNVTAQLLMRGCLRERRPEEAVRIFRRSSSSSRDGLMYSLAVQAACKVPDLGMALGLLREIREKLGVCGSQETYTSVVVACVKEGRVEEAVRVKDEMVGLGIPVSVVAATSLVTGYCKEGEFGKALDLFDEKGLEGRPDKVMFSVMIEWLCRKDRMEEAVEVYRRMRAVGITLSSDVVHTMLIKGCLRAESPETALEIFNETGGLAHGFLCNTILQLLCKQDKVDAARRLVKVMEDRGIEINVVSYNNLMLAHCRRKDMGLARSVYSVMLEKGLEPTSFTYSILIDGFFKNRDEESACDVVNQMFSSSFEASEVVYNTIINGLCKVGQTSKAREMLQDLIKEKRCSVSCMSYNSIIDGFFREGETDSAVETYREMMSENRVSPNVVTFTSLINGFCKSGRMDLVLEMRQEMERKDVKLDVPAYGALIHGFCKKRDMKTAVSLFSELVELGLVPNVSVYNSLISGFRNLGDMVAALDLYKKMVSDGIKCDLFTYTTLIDGLLKDGDLISASDLYSEVLASGIVPDEVLYVVLVNGLSKKGQFVKASKMLEELKKRDEVTPNVLIYTTVIAGHYREGNLDKAFQLQEEMIEKGLEYNHTIFDLLMSGKVEKTHAACSQS